MWGSYGSAVQRLVLLQPPLSAERGRATAVAAGEEMQPGAADTWASVHAVHRPATANSSNRWYNIYLLGAAAPVRRSYRLVVALDWLIGGGWSGRVSRCSVQVCESEELHLVYRGVMTEF